jgi:hypothetical protein
VSVILFFFVFVATHAIAFVLNYSNCLNGQWLERDRGHFGEDVFSFEEIQKMSGEVLK